jgi:mycothiol S-conjugate amidase
MQPKSRCLLAIHAHPDDESSKGAGTMAKYAAEGVRVVLACATDGAEGDILNPRMDRPGIKDRMVELRRAELETACDILGVERIYHLGYRDSGMPGSEANRHPDAFCNADPDVVLAYDESKGYEHPDHVRVYELGTRAYHEAGDADRFPDAGAPWQPKKLYYFATFTQRRFRILNDAAVAAGAEAPYAGWLEKWDEFGFAEPEITTQVDVAEYVEVRSKALLAHATQIDPDSFWFAVPDELQRQVYPWEDYTLIDSKVSTEVPEDDLFAGIDTPAPPAVPERR